MNENREPVEIKITQDKLVDLLLHAATREDIADLRQEMKTDIIKLQQRFDSFEAKYQQQIGSFETKFQQKIESFEARVGRQFQKVDNRYNWIIGTVLACSIGLATLIIKMH